MKTTFFAFIVEFIIFDMFFVGILIALNLPDESLKMFTYGGYLSLK